MRSTILFETTWALAALLSATAAFGNAAVAGETSTPTPICFEVWRGDSDIGRHRLRFEPTADGLVAEIAIDLRLGLGPITLFRYSHRNRELWQDGRLMKIDTRTDDDGSRFAVSGRATESGLLVESAAGRQLLPPEVVPTSYWREKMMRSANWLDSQDGSAIQVKVAATAPLPGTVRGYAVSGDLELVAGYDNAGQWRGLSFNARGSRVDYRPCTAEETAMTWHFDLDDLSAVATAAAVRPGTGG